MSKEKIADREDPHLADFLEKVMKFPFWTNSEENNEKLLEEEFDDAWDEYNAIRQGIVN